MAQEFKVIFTYFESCKSNSISNQFYLRSLCVFVCFLLFDLSNFDSNIEIITKILNLIGIEQKPVYYELICDQPKIKKRRKSSKSKFKFASKYLDDSDDEIDDENSLQQQNVENQSGWIVPSLFNPDEKIQFSPFDISNYIATYYILKSLHVLSTSENNK